QRIGGGSARAHVAPSPRRPAGAAGLAGERESGVAGARSGSVDCDHGDGNTARDVYGQPGDQRARVPRERARGRRHVDGRARLTREDAMADFRQYTHCVDIKDFNPMNPFAQAALIGLYVTLPASVIPVLMTLGGGNPICLAILLEIFGIAGIIGYCYW